MSLKQYQLTISHESRMRIPWQILWKWRHLFVSFIERDWFQMSRMSLISLCPDFISCKFYELLEKIIVASIWKWHTRVLNKIWREWQFCNLIPNMPLPPQKVLNIKHASRIKVGMFCFTTETLEWDRIGNISMKSKRIISRRTWKNRSFKKKYWKKILHALIFVSIKRWQVVSVGPGGWWGPYDPLYWP